MKLTDEQEIAFHNWIKAKIASKEMTELEDGFYLYLGLKQQKFSLQTYFKMETRK